METLEERKSNKNKMPISENFLAELDKIAKDNVLIANDVWMLWQKYVLDCHDQSAIVLEFKDWYNLK